MPPSLHFDQLYRIDPPLPVPVHFCERRLQAKRGNMKAVTLLVFVVVIVAVSCRPDKPDLKQLKAEAARKKACMHDCTSAKFEPVCAGKQGDKPKSFGSECVMNNYNCENKDSLRKISKGECPGSDGIRLS